MYLVKSTVYKTTYIDICNIFLLPVTVTWTYVNVYECVCTYYTIVLYYVHYVIMCTSKGIFMYMYHGYIHTNNANCSHIFTIESLLYIHICTYIDRCNILLEVWFSVMGFWELQLKCRTNVDGFLGYLWNANLEHFWNSVGMQIKQFAKSSLCLQTRLITLVGILN